MSNDTGADLREHGCAVLDPALSPWQRRYFYQPDDGPARRGFTARRAERGWPAPIARVANRWTAARHTASVQRSGTVWF